MDKGLQLTVLKGYMQQQNKRVEIQSFFKVYLASIENFITSRGLFGVYILKLFAT